MAKSAQPVSIDVLILGDHPSAYLAAAVLKHKTKLRVGHVELKSEESNDRLVTLNPAMFGLHPLLAGIDEKLKTTGVFGIRFLADDAQTSSESREKSAVIYVAKFKEIRDRIENIAREEGAELFGLKSVHIRGLDETGVDVTIGRQQLRATALVLVEPLPSDQQLMLGISDSWDTETLHRFTTIKCKNTRHLNLPAAPTMPMSLDLNCDLCWGWLLPGDGEFQLSVEQPIDGSKGSSSGLKLLRHWVSVLQLHGVLGEKFDFPSSSITTVDLPLAGALAREGVANRTLLIGPAGGFYSACGEEIYPACWSAIHAAEVLKKALREPHLQDGLNAYRQRWSATLGDYLRGPHQNLRFLLPLVYRNPTMTSRLAEAILLSKSVVR